MTWSGPCIEWGRAQDNHGYGVVRVKGVLKKAHRVAYEEKYGPIPTGLDLDHLCRNRLCVNPDHLEPVTRAENLRRGLRTKLTLEQVREIRALAGKMGQRQIEKKYGLSHGHVSRIINGRRSDGSELWKEVGGS